MERAHWMSIVIPALNEAGTLPLLLADLRALPFPVQIIVADGGSTDLTTAVAMEGGASVVHAAKGRGRQLRAGATQATAPLLGFLHADARLPDESRKQIASIAQHGFREQNVAVVFTLKIDSPRWPYRVVEAGAAWRTRLFALPYGDQGLFLSRRLYDVAGGFADVPLMEDVEMMRSLRGVAKIQMSAAPIVVSPRRWERDGVWTRSVRNIGLLLRWYMGTSPEQLAVSYERSRRMR